MDRNPNQLSAYGMGSTHPEGALNAYQQTRTETMAGWSEAWLEELQERPGNPGAWGYPRHKIYCPGCYAPPKWFSLEGYHTAHRTRETLD